MTDEEYARHMEAEFEAIWAGAKPMLDKALIGGQTDLVRSLCRMMFMHGVRATMEEQVSR
jgi:hypothetical protein